MKGCMSQRYRRRPSGCRLETSATFISSWSFPGRFKHNENGEKLWPIEKKS